jgi:hypothetical protein
MKQQILEGLKKKLLLVEIVHSGENLGLKKEEIKDITKLTHITEDKFAEWVQLISNGKITGQKQYRKDSDTTGIPANMWVTTAKESFFSYLESQGIYFKNKLGEKPEMFDSLLVGKNCKYEYPHGYDIEQYRKDLEVWEEAEQKVWNKDLIYIFQII